jgi:hypothetical protein
MKFRCVDCDAVMTFAEQQAPAPSVLEAVYGCPQCGRRIAMVTNPLETQLVVDASAPAEPQPTPERGGAADPPEVSGPSWSPAAITRLGRVPPFVRGVLQKMYTDYARERGIAEVTPDVMDQARAELGLGGM